jgi:hypothetical protein
LKEEEEEANDRERQHRNSLFMMVFFPLLSSKAVSVVAISDETIFCGVLWAVELEKNSPLIIIIIIITGTLTKRR